MSESKGFNYLLIVLFAVGVTVLGAHDLTARFNSSKGAPLGNSPFSPLGENERRGGAPSDWSTKGASVVTGSDSDLAVSSEKRASFSFFNRFTGKESPLSVQNDTSDLGASERGRGVRLTQGSEEGERTRRGSASDLFFGQSDGIFAGRSDRRSSATPAPATSVLEKSPQKDGRDSRENAAIEASETSSWFGLSRRRAMDNLDHPDKEELNRLLEDVTD